MTTALQKAPRITLNDAELMTADLYGLDVSAAPLPSERDQNFALRNASGEQFVLKIANAEEQFEFLELQNQLIQFLAARDLDLEFPRIVQTKSGQAIGTIKGEDGHQHFVRLLTWIDGVCLAKVEGHDRKLLASLGRALAQMDAALAQFSHAAAHRSFYWDLRNAGMARELIELLPESRRSMIERFFGEWEKIDWSSLRFSIIHNDANDYNILVRRQPEQRVNAILDYGDVVHTATVCDLAIALAYVMLDKPDPISAAAQVIAAYHETYPLIETEVEVLYRLAGTRLCCSVCFAATQTHECPDNEYLNISNAPAWRLLEKLSNISFDLPTRIFRYAFGLPVVKGQDSRKKRTSVELLAARDRHLGPSLSISYQPPLHIVCGSRP